MSVALSSASRLRCFALVALVALAASLIAPRLAGAQASSTFTACTQGDLANCAVVRLTSQANGGTGGLNLFEIAVRNVGSQNAPTLATSIYNLIFTTGQPEAPDDAIDAAVAPVSVGGATIADATEWDLFDSGDALFLTALANNGVGNCIAGAPVNGFSQAGTTCVDEYLSFSFSTTRLYDPTLFVLSDYEVASLSNPQLADSCGGTSCVVTTTGPITATPEPGALALAITGFSGVVGVARRRRGTRVI